MGIEDYTNEELGRMIRQAAKGQKYDWGQESRSRSGFVRFLRGIGLAWLADKIMGLAQAAVNWLWALVLG